MISVKRAETIIDGEARPVGTVRVDLESAVGRVLAEDIIADTDMPPFDRSQMDGYAVRAADTVRCPARLAITGESSAGSGFNGNLGRGEAVRIMTGAPLPRGADAVQKLELATEEGASVMIMSPTEKGRFIVRKASEVRRGEQVLLRGTRIKPQNVAGCAAFGYTKVKVARRPVVAIFSTGNEVVPIGRRPNAHQIRNSNSIMLAAYCRATGCDVTILENASDDLDGIVSRLKIAKKSADIVLTTGGVSVGKYDLTKPAIEAIGGDILFERVAVKPGKPTVFAKLGRTFFFGLPGNPVSAAVTWQLFVRRMLLRMQSSDDAVRPVINVTAGGRFRGTKGRVSYLPARLSTDAHGSTIAKPLSWRGSSDFVGFSRADCLVITGMGAQIDEGDVAKALRLG